MEYRYPKLSAEAKRDHFIGKQLPLIVVFTYLGILVGGSLLIVAFNG